MAKIRDEVVGKRFLSVSGGSKLKLSKICEWDWRAGIIRACTHTDAKHPDLQVLVEYDDVSWQRREWVSVHQSGAFQVFLLEHTLVYAPRPTAPSRHHRAALHHVDGVYPARTTAPHRHHRSTPQHPALKFILLVDNVGLSEHKTQPVEYLTDRGIDHLDPGTLLPHQEGGGGVTACRGVPEAEAAVRAWVAEQDGQRILVDTPSVLVGFRVQVYRAEGTTQWYTAVIVNYNDTTKELTVTDDTVLEEHSEDPCLLQIRLLGEGVVDSILRGESVGITPRRSRSHAAPPPPPTIRHIRRETGTAGRPRKTPVPRPHATPAPLSRPHATSPSSSPNAPPAPSHNPPIGIKITNSNNKLTTNVILPVSRVTNTNTINRLVTIKSNSININPKVTLSADLNIDNYTSNIKADNNNKSPKSIKEAIKANLTSKNTNNNTLPAPLIQQDTSPATPPADATPTPRLGSSSPCDTRSDSPHYPPSPTDGVRSLPDEAVVTLADNPLPTPPADSPSTMTSSSCTSVASTTVSSCPSTTSVSFSLSSATASTSTTSSCTSPKTSLTTTSSTTPVSSSSSSISSLDKSVVSSSFQLSKTSTCSDSTRNTNNTPPISSTCSVSSISVKSSKDAFKAVNDEKNRNNRNQIYPSTKKTTTSSIENSKSISDPTVSTLDKGRSSGDTSPSSDDVVFITSSKATNLCTSLTSSTPDRSPTSLISSSSTKQSTKSSSVTRALDSREKRGLPTITATTSGLRNAVPHNSVSKDIKRSVVPTNSVVNKDGKRNVGPTSSVVNKDEKRSVGPTSSVVSKDAKMLESQTSGVSASFPPPREKNFTVAASSSALPELPHRDGSGAATGARSSRRRLPEDCHTPLLTPRPSLLTPAPSPLGPATTKPSLPSFSSTSTTTTASSSVNRTSSGATSATPGFSSQFGRTSSVGGLPSPPVRPDLGATTLTSPVSPNLSANSRSRHSQVTPATTSPTSFTTSPARPQISVKPVQALRPVRETPPVASQHYNSPPPTNNSSSTSCSSGSGNSSANHTLAGRTTHGSQPAPNSSSSSRAKTTTSSSSSNYLVSNTSQVPPFRSTSPITRKLPSSTTLTTTSPPHSRVHPSLTTLTNSNAPTLRPVATDSPLNRLPASTTLTTTSAPISRTSTLSTSSSLAFTAPSQTTGSSNTSINITATNTTTNINNSTNNNILSPPLRSYVGSGISPVSTNVVLQSRNASISVIKSTVTSTNIIQSSSSSNLQSSAPSISSGTTSVPPTSLNLKNSLISTVSFSRPQQGSGPSSLEISRNPVHSATAVSHDTAITTTISNVTSSSSSLTLSSASGLKNTSVKTSGPSSSGPHPHHQTVVDIVPVPAAPTKQDLSSSTQPTSKCSPLTLNTSHQSSSISEKLCNSNNSGSGNNKYLEVVSVTLGSDSNKKHESCAGIEEKSILKSKASTPILNECDVIEVVNPRNCSSSSNNTSKHCDLNNRLGSSSNIGDKRIKSNSCSVPSRSSSPNSTICTGSVTVSNCGSSSSSQSHLRDSNRGGGPAPTGTGTATVYRSGTGSGTGPVSVYRNGGLYRSGSAVVGRGGGGSGGAGGVVAGVSGRAVSITATSGPAPHAPSRPASPPSVSITAVLRPQHPSSSSAPPSAATHHGPSLHSQQPTTLPSGSPTAALQHHSPAALLSSGTGSSHHHMPPYPRMDDGSSDSGVSLTEPRSVSRSSILSDERSSSAEVKPNTPTPQQHPSYKVVSSSSSLTHHPLSHPGGGGINNFHGSSSSGSNSNPNNHHPNSGGGNSSSSFALDHRNNKEVRVWRDPALLSQSEQAVRHIHSLQHAMSYPPHAPPPPPHHASPHGAHSPHSVAVAAAAAAAAAAGLPGLSFPHGHPLHLPGLPTAAAAFYGASRGEMWKQLAGVPPALHPAYHGLLPHGPGAGATQEEILRELERPYQDRSLRDRRELEAREKDRVKMEREKMERERRQREREEKDKKLEREEKDRQKHQVAQHFEESLRLAEQKKSGGWGSIPPMDERRYMEQQRHREEFRRHQQQVPDPNRVVQESIYKAYRHEEDQRRDMREAAGIPPPPAHAKLDKNMASNVAAAAAMHAVYPSVYSAVKDPKMVQYALQQHHDKQSVIVQPDPKYDKSHSKQRVQGRASPYQQPNMYKSYEISQSPHRGSSGTPHQPSSLNPSPHNVPSLVPSPHSLDIAKARQPQPSPHSSISSPGHHERYYPSKSPSTSYQSPHPAHVSHSTLPSHPSHAQLTAHVQQAQQQQQQQQHPISSSHSLPLSGHHQIAGHPPSHPSMHSSSPRVSVSLVPNPQHVVAQVPLKTKVNSPPPQVYPHPEANRVSSQHIPHTKPALQAPPPAHSSNRNLNSIPPPPPPHEPRALIDRGTPYEARAYPANVPSPHHKPMPTPPPVVQPPPPQRVPGPIHTAPPPPVHSPVVHPTQTQPLDLGTRDDTASPSKRRTQTPTPQDCKKPRLEVPAGQALISKVSEPSPLFSTALTTITSVENVAAFPNSSGSTSNSRVHSPAPSNHSSSRPPSQPPASVTPTLSRPDSTNSPGSNSTTKSEPEKSSSPGPGSGAGYVHKLKKAWMQRHESGAEVPPSTSSPSQGTRTTSPPPTSSLNGGGSNSSSGPKSPAVSVGSAKSDDGGGKSSSSWKSKGASNLPNGHSQDSKDVDSTSTDSDDGSTTQKSSRGKGKRSVKRPKKTSDTNSESDKESDGSETSSKKSSRLSSKQDLEPKKRGRKPKTKLEKEKDKEDGPKPKKIKEELIGDPLKKPPLHQLKKTGESFLQDDSCFEVSAKLPKCRECRWTPHQRNKKMPNIFCRFYAFRRLRYTKNGQLAVAGFSDPVKDAYGEDLRLWVPDSNNPVKDLDVEKSKFLITHVGDQLCDLVQQEKHATQLHMANDCVVAWKRVVQGVREMCDVCETTLFNIHWACSKCGFVVCIDCYKGRKNGTVKVWDDAGNKERDEYQWLLCTSRVPHEQEKLMLTQIISGNALLELGKKIHQVRHEYGIPQLCGCDEAQKYADKEVADFTFGDDKKKLNGISKDLLKNVKDEPKSGGLVNGSVKSEKRGNKTNGKDEDDDMSNSPLSMFADVALSYDKRDSESSNSDSGSDSDDKESNQSTLRKLLARPNSRPGSRANHAKDEPPQNAKKKPKLETLDDVISCVIEPNSGDKETKLEHKVELKHFIRKYRYNRVGLDLLPIRIMTKTESSLLYPNVAHSWLCDGKLLRLHDPTDPNNIHIFQDQWKRGQPVIVSDAGRHLKQDLWRPYSFSRDFGEVKNDLINCLTGNIVPNQTMKKFWDGFENYSKRLKDEKGNPMILKLKDWPPGDDFSEFLPKRYDDLTDKLPMSDYTKRDGSLNLASRLPECFVKPDLGPKMYIAYGSALFPNKASTNLHLDISDAVNVMCYSGVPKDGSTEEDVKAALKAIDDAGCDLLTRRRAREPETVPGALWHIYHARDADKIRDLLNKVAIANGVKLEPHHDPIHDQSWYLDRSLRERLYKEYGVEGYSILQCMGDAVFIPAGAPHQVRNLHNCIKVAEDFVSPENVAHCFHLTQEFRHLSDNHTNHEDKLQIKNIIYHAMKDSVAVLMGHKKREQNAIGDSSSSGGSGNGNVNNRSSPGRYSPATAGGVKVKREQSDS